VSEVPWAFHSHFAGQGAPAGKELVLPRRDGRQDGRRKEPVSSLPSLSLSVSLRAAVLKGEDFREWETVLNKYFKRLPPRFTRTYKWLFEGGVLRMYALADSVEPVHTIKWADCEATMRRALLQDIMGSPDLRLAEIVAQRPILPLLPPTELTATKLVSLQKKLEMVPDKYRAYFPQGAQPADDEDDAAVPAQQPDDAAVPAQQLRRPVGRPPKSKPAERGVRSIIEMWGSQSQSQSQQC
jgi:hypothetical protein